MKRESAILLTMTLICGLVVTNEAPITRKLVKVAAILDSTCMSPDLFSAEKEIVNGIISMLETDNVDIQLAALHVTNAFDNLLSAKLLFNFLHINQSAELTKIVNATDVINKDNNDNNVLDLYDFLVTTMFPAKTKTQMEVNKFLLLFTSACNYKPYAIISKSLCSSRCHMEVIFMPNSEAERRTNVSKEVMGNFLRTSVASGLDMLHTFDENADISQLVGKVIKKIYSTVLGNDDIKEEKGEPKDLLTLEISLKQHFLPDIPATTDEKLLQSLLLLPVKFSNKIFDNKYIRQSIEMLQVGLRLSSGGLIKQETRENDADGENIPPAGQDKNYQMKYINSVERKNHIQKRRMFESLDLSKYFVSLASVCILLMFFIFIVTHLSKRKVGLSQKSGEMNSLNNDKLSFRKPTLN